MHFTTLASTAAIIGSVMAGDYYYATTTHSEAAHMTTKVYTSVSTCTKGAEGKPTTSVYHYTTSAPAPYYAYSSSSSSYAAHETPITYTSYEHITVTSCAEYVKSCPAKTYTTEHYSTTCTGSQAHPTPEHPVYSAPYYAPHSNMSTPAVPYYQPTTTPAVYIPHPTTTSSVSMVTVYTTVCPGVNYCYGTTITSTYSPSTTPAVPVYTSSSMTPSKPTYSAPAAPVCPGGAYCPPSGTNGTTPVYSQPPAATGAASSVKVSFGLGLVAAIAAFVAL